MSRTECGVICSVPTGMEEEPYEAQIIVDGSNKTLAGSKTVAGVFA
jgi:hypothetical protein